MNQAGMYKRNTEQPEGKTDHFTDMNIKHSISALLLHSSPVDLNR